MVQLSGRQIRERRWAVARRIGARHELLAARWPRAVRAADAVLRRVLIGCVRLELPRAAAVMELGTVAMPGSWPTSGVGECRGLWHGYRLRLDLSDYYQRIAFLMARYHEIGLQLLMRRALRPGDLVIDGGANNGLSAMIAAWRVGPGGRVLAFEPNPRVFEQLRWHVEQNGLAQVTMVPMGLSDREEELELCVPGRDNLGAGTFTPLPRRYGGQVQQRCVTRVVRGDELAELQDLATPTAKGELMIKLDVEGFELRALRGLAGLIQARRPLVVCEMNREMLRMAGTSPAEVMSFMAERGYRAFDFAAQRAIVRLRRLEMRELRSGDELPFDVAWVHPESGMWERLRETMVSPEAG